MSMPPPIEQNKKNVLIYLKQIELSATAKKTTEISKKHILKKKNHNLNHQFLKWIASRPHNFDKTIFFLLSFFNMIYFRIPFKEFNEQV